MVKDTKVLLVLCEESQFCIYEVSELPVGEFIIVLTLCSTFLENSNQGLGELPRLRGARDFHHVGVEQRPRGCA